MKKKIRAFSCYLLIVGWAILISACTNTRKPNTKKDEGTAVPYKTALDDSTLFGEKAPFIMPYNRIIEAAGESVRFGEANVENHSLDAVLMPDAQTIVVEDRFGLAFFNSASHRLIDRWSYRKEEKYQGSMSTFSGIKTFVHNDSTYIFWGAGGKGKPNSCLMQAYWDGRHAKFIKAIPFEPIPPATIALPNEVVIRAEAGELYAYTVLNGNNQLIKVRVKDSKVMWAAPTGVAPFGITLIHNKAYVTNWAGSIPDSKNGLETAGIPWGSAYIDPKTGATSQGTVSVINIKQGKAEKEVRVGLHPNAIIASPDEKFVYVANGNSDYISVINTQTEKVSDSIYVGLFQQGIGYIGSTPNALAINKQGTTLYVANALDNAICVVSLGKQTSSDGKGQNKIQGYIPTEAYPSGIVLLNNELFVTNLEAIGARIAQPVSQQSGTKKSSSSEQKAFNSHKQLASVSFIALPNAQQLNAYTAKVKKLNHQFRLALAEQMPRPDVLPKPVPERIGEPSVFKYVLYIIKENRTYDQVLGDMPTGNGMPSLCIFGDSVTPNQHQLAKDYMLMDNYYVSGKSSAEGHHWANAAMVTDYTQKSVRAWFRSYPHVLNDAMVYNKKGLIWNNALDHGKTVRMYGEAITCEFDTKTYNWAKLYEMRQQGKTFPFVNTSTISRVRPIIAASFPGGNNESVSDQMRADAFIKELHETAAKPGGQLPNLMIMALPNDHTAGLNPAFPTPQAMVADNDLAVGRIVEAMMSSRFADSTVIFISEDDSQAGWDHVSAYRTTGFVISKYSRLQKTIHTNYNQTSLIRTIEQILGLPPMNVIDATALPMFDCFTNQPNLSFKYTALPSRIPLNEMNPAPAKLKGEALRYTNLSIQYAFQQIDQGHDDLLNRILWFSSKGKKRYPAKMAGNAEEENEEDDD